MFRKPAGPIGPYVPGPTSTVSSAFLPPVFYTESSILANSAVVQLYGDEIEERNARQHTCDLNFCFFVFTESAVDLRSTDRTSDGYEWGHRTGSRGHFNKTSDQDSAGHGASKKFHTKVRLSITKQYETRRTSVPVEERNIKRATQTARRNGTRATAGGRECRSHFSRLARFEKNARGVLLFPAVTSVFIRRHFGRGRCPGALAGRSAATLQ